MVEARGGGVGVAVQDNVMRNAGTGRCNVREVGRGACHLEGNALLDSARGLDLLQRARGEQGGSHLLEGAASGG